MRRHHIRQTTHTFSHGRLIVPAGPTDSVRAANADSVRPAPQPQAESLVNQEG